jgi:putative flippase GtrA
MRVLKFLITGAIGLAANLGTFHILYTSGVPYLVGSIAAFAVALFVGFVLQKYWTFEDSAPERMQKQFVLYTSLALGNLAINTLVVYLLVEHAAAHHLVAQTVGAGLVALTSYLAYRHYIFVERSEIQR